MFYPFLPLLCEDLAHSPFSRQSSCVTKLRAMHIWALLLCCLAGITQRVQGGESCQLMVKSTQGSVYQAGDLVIGGLFPVHVKAPQPDLEFRGLKDSASCEIFHQRAYRWLQAMIFAVEEINNNTNFLPNFTLGYLVSDTCLAERTTLLAAMSMVTGQEANLSASECGSVPTVPVVVGDPRSSASIIVANTIGVFNIPMVSYLASCGCLSDKTRYPLFFRTMPSDAAEARAMAELLRLMGWTWVGLVSADDDFGRFGIQMLMDALRGTEVCVAFHEVIPKDYAKMTMQKIVDTIRTSTATVVVAFIIDLDAKALFDEVVEQNVTDKQWVANDAWITYSVLSVPRYVPSLAGTLGFALRRADIPGLGSFLARLHPSSSNSDPFVKELWESLFGCSFSAGLGMKVCSGSEVIGIGESLYSDVSQLRITYNVYKAVYAIANAVREMLACEPGEGPFLEGWCPDVWSLQPVEIAHYLKKVNFSTPLKERMHFDRNGDPPASYDIINWHVAAQGAGEFVTVGHFLSDRFHINMEAVLWGGGSGKEVPVSVCSSPCPAGTRRAVQRSRPVCCFDCLPCADGDISNKTGLLECVRCPERFWSNPTHTVCVPQQVDFLSYSDTMGIILSLVSALGTALTAATFATFLYYRHTPLVRANNSEVSFMLLVSLKLCFLCALAFIGQPVAWSCMLRHTLFGISFVLCISCLLSRTVVVLVAFRSTLPGETLMRYVGPAQQRLGISICTLVQVLICALWLTLAPPQPAERNTMGTWGPKIILECAMGSVVAFSLVLGYMGLLACLCLLLAFLARTLPDNFNEAKLITFSMLIFCSVWVTFVPAYISSPGKYTVAVEIFAILASSYGLLFCIFAPKCFIIFMRPEKNTKKHLMAR